MHNSSQKPAQPGTEFRHLDLFTGVFFGEEEGGVIPSPAEMGGRFGDAFQGFGDALMHRKGATNSYGE